MNLDLSWAITTAIAVCALISPIITTLINNHHQKVMKKLEYKELEKEKRIERKRDIFENYLRSAGAVVQMYVADNVNEFGKFSARALCYAPEYLQEDMIQLEHLVFDQNQDEARIQLNKVVFRLRPLLQEL